MKKLVVVLAILVLSVFVIAKIMTEDAVGPSQAVTIQGVTITPLEVLEDSRCPEDVQCVWAGTLKLLANIRKSSDAFNQVLELGQSVSLGSEEITLISASPDPKAGENIPFEKYRFEFEVEKESAPPNPSTGECHVTGCSAQLCTEESDVVSTCEWREAYACYQTAKCERQPNGQCGWTPTVELNQCLTNAR